MASEIRPLMISLDDYYVNRDQIPIDENGKRIWNNKSSWYRTFK